MLGREWTFSTGVIQQATASQKTVRVRIADANTPNSHHPLKVGNALVTPLVVQVSMDGGYHLLSGETSARLHFII